MNLEKQESTSLCASEAPIVDTHCHLDFDVIHHRLEAELSRCAALGVKGFLVPGVKRDFWARLFELESKFSCCRISIGLHPYYILEHRLEHLDDLQGRLYESRSISAVGEIGLDKYCPLWDLQVVLFREQVRIAQCFDLPIIVHARKAHSDILQYLTKGKFSGRGVIHGFSGSFELALAYLDKGLYIGVGGVITYPRASKTRAAITRLPLDRLLIETDSPSMPLYQQAEGSNLPSNVTKVLDTLCCLKGLSRSEVIEQLYKNSCCFLGVDAW